MFGCKNHDKTTFLTFSQIYEPRNTTINKQTRRIVGLNKELNNKEYNAYLKEGKKKPDEI